MNATDTIVPAEAAHFGKLAADWWDPKGSSAMLHRLNPVRLGYVRERADAHWGLDPRARRPLIGKRALDVGCGAGLLAEPLARLGAEVVAVDAAPENIAVARTHAEGQALAIDYRAGDLAAVAGERFDLVTAMEVIEHVADPAAFVAGLAAALDDDGLLILSTPNRTNFSRLAMIGVAEGLGFVPRGTHDWSRFLTGDELRGLMEAAGLVVADLSGIAFDPMRGFRVGRDARLNLIVSAGKALTGK